MVSKGIPPKSTFTNGKGYYLLVADLTAPVLYRLRSSTLFVHALNDDFTQLAAAPFDVPDECNRLSEKSRPTSWQHLSGKLYHQIAFTRNMQLRFFILDEKSESIYFARTEPFEIPEYAHLVMAFPRQIVQGQPLAYQLYGDRDKGEFEIMTGPQGLTISPSGELAWTPTVEQVGEHPVKIRSVIKGTTSFQRLTINVVSSELADAVDGDLSKVADAGNLEFDLPITVMLPSLDAKSTLVVAGNQLSVLDANGLVVKKQHDLAKSYKKFAERDEYYVGLSDNSFDLLDKTTLKIIKSYELTVGRTVDFALHPARDISYVTVFDDNGGRRSSIEAKRIWQVDETNGKTTELSRMFGTFVETDPAGKYLFVALRDRYERGLRIDWNIGRVTPDYGEIDVLIAYDIRGRTPRHVATNLKAGANGSRIITSPDGKHIAYVSGGGTPTYSYAIPAFKSDDIESAAASYRVGAYPKDISFHPTLNLTAGANGKECQIFVRNSGEKVERLKIDDPKLQTKVQRVLFAPSGSRVLLAREISGGVRNLVSVPIDITLEERKLLEKGFQRPELAALIDRDDADPSTGQAGVLARGGEIPADELQALIGKGASRKVSAREIARHYTRSVVLVEAEGATGTGFVIWNKGYIVTCAHLLPPLGDPVVSYQVDPGPSAKVKKARARVLRIDEKLDLALLKVDISDALHPVQLLRDGTIESAEDVTVIGNPGAGDTVLTNSITTGIVSSRRRRIDDAELIQTSAPINPGNSGGPMFNERGLVIGVVVSKARLENTGFAVPVKQLLGFLDIDEAQKVELFAPRIWTDTSGKFKVQAALVRVTGETARLRRADGEFIDIPVARLSQSDQDYLVKSKLAKP